MSISTNEGRCIGIFVLGRSRPLQNLPKFSFVRHSWIECGRHDETIYECPRHTMTEPERSYATKCRYTRIRIRQAEDVFVRHAAGRHDIDTAKFRQSIWAPWVVFSSNWVLAMSSSVASWQSFSCTQIAAQEKGAIPKHRCSTHTMPIHSPSMPEATAIPHWIHRPLCCCFSSIVSRRRHTSSYHKAIENMDTRLCQLREACVLDEEKKICFGQGQKWRLTKPPLIGR